MRNVSNTHPCDPFSLYGARVTITPGALRQNVVSISSVAPFHNFPSNSCNAPEIHIAHQKQAELTNLTTYFDLHPDIIQSVLEWPHGTFLAPSNGALAEMRVKQDAFGIPLNIIDVNDTSIAALFKYHMLAPLLIFGTVRYSHYPGRGYIHESVRWTSSGGEWSARPAAQSHVRHAEHLNYCRSCEWCRMALVNVC